MMKPANRGRPFRSRFDRSVQNSRTLNDSQEDDDDEEEETDVEKNSESFIVVPIRWFNLVADATACANTFVQVKHKTLEEKFQCNSLVLK